MSEQSTHVGDRFANPARPAKPAATPGPLFVLVAGEASGDTLGAGLIDGLRARFAGAQFAGIGGPRMAAAGMDIWHPADALSVMGLVEVLAHLPNLLSIRRDVRRRVLQRRPAAFIGIDAPDFNLGLERHLKSAGIRCIHYVSPSIWAWREKRVERIGRSADCVLCLFPMEPAIYARHGVDARFVGHPLARQFPVHPDQGAARRTLGLPADAPILALLPGSRLNEIRRLGADFMAAAQRLRQTIPELHVAVPLASHGCRAAFEHLPGIDQPDTEHVHLFDGRAHEVMIASDAVLLASGTAALEAMLAKRPMVVAYRLAWLTHWLVRTLGLLHTEVYSLPNILAGERLVPELMQDACTPESLAEHLLPYLQARQTPETLLARFEQLHRMLMGDPQHDAAAQVAALIANNA